MNKNIIKAEDLPEKEDIYLKRDWAGYRIVHPTRNADGSINWLNLLVGGRRNLVFLIVVLLCIGFLLYAYEHDIAAMRDVVESPCSYCEGSQDYVGVDLSEVKIWMPENAEG